VLGLEPLVILWVGFRVRVRSSRRELMRTCTRDVCVNCGQLRITNSTKTPY